jgi:ankyrin repeat protein
VKALIQKGAALNQQDAFGFTALHVAALKGSPEAVGLLMEAGASSAICDSNGRNAYEVALRFK